MRIFEQCVAIYMVLLLPQTQDVDCCRVPRSKPPFHALGRGILSPTACVQEDFVFGAELIQSTRHDIRTATGAGTRSWPLDPHPVETRGWCHSGAGVCRRRDWLSRRGSQIQLGWHRFACRSLGGDVSAGIHADVDCHTRCFVRGEEEKGRPYVVHGWADNHSVEALGRRAMQSARFGGAAWADRRPELHPSTEATRMAGNQGTENTLVIGRALAVMLRSPSIQHSMTAVALSIVHLHLIPL